MAIKSITWENKTFDISYEIINPSKENIIIFLHGWGSNKEIMKQGFGTQLKEYKHIYIDMPGFGKSSNNYILTTNDYANILKVFLKSLIPNHYNLTTIVGHSFGGKVSTLLNPSTLVLLSSAGIVEEKYQPIDGNFCGTYCFKRESFSLIILTTARIIKSA